MSSEALPELTTEDIIRHVDNLFYPDGNRQLQYNQSLDYDNGRISGTDKQVFCGASEPDGVVVERTISLRDPSLSVTMYERFTREGAIERTLYMAGAEQGVNGNKLQGQMHPFEYRDLTKFVRFTGK